MSCRQKTGPISQAIALHNHTCAYVAVTQLSWLMMQSVCPVDTIHYPTLISHARPEYPELVVTHSILFFLQFSPDLFDCRRTNLLPV